MCGICGIAGERGRPDRAEILRRMTGAIRHRGPDDEGFAEAPSGGAAFGFRRLSIIDLAGGHQPMTSEDGRILLVLNGEIYNFRELRDRLEKQGHRFASRSDAEVVVHLYEERGVECVEELQGMFAFALWDDRDQSLFLARDRLGKKPLSYHHEGGRLIFASEIKAILRHPDVRREFNPEALPFYLSFLYVPAPLTMFRGIRKLPPGHWLRFRDGKTEIRRYWEPKPAPRDMTMEEATERIYHSLSRAVERRLVSDVPLGAFLSGGIDSSIVVGLMAQHLREPVKTFSIGFGEPQYDEVSHARIVAEHFRTEHREFTVRPDAVEVLPKLIWQYDEPFADSSAIPTYHVSLKTAEHVKVALSGDGGDEGFGGYRRYSVIDRLGRWKRLPWPARPAFGLMGSILGLLPITKGAPARLRGRIQNLLRSMDLPLSGLYREVMSFFSEKDLAALRGGAALSADVIEYIREPFERHAVDPVSAGGFTDLLTYLSGDILAKVDIASMACGLEVRSPFLDPEVLEVAFHLPGRMKVSGSETKMALKRTFQGLLPPSILERSKMGFGMPVNEWLRGDLRPWVEEIVLSPQARQRGLFDGNLVEGLAREHLAGAVDRGHPLWILLCLELWFRTYIDADGTGPISLKAGG